MSGSMVRIVEDAALRLFAQSHPYRALQALEQGGYDVASLDRFESSGFAELLAGALEGEEAASMAAAALALLHAAGYHHAPLPVAESLVARALAARAGIALPEGGVLVSAEPCVDAVKADGGAWRLQGRAARVPWARHASHVLVLASDGHGHRVGWVSAGAAGLARVEGSNVAGEPRDGLVFEGTPFDTTLAEPVVVDRGVAEAFGLLRAMCVAAQMTGAAEAALDASVKYASERIQFGQPIFRFQAVQQQLAVLGGEVAAARAACGLAFAGPAGGDWRRVAIAKMRAGQAAGVATDVAHQVHGAIGVTQEYPLHYLTRRLWAWRAEAGAESAWALRLGRHVIERGATQLWPDLVALRDPATAP